MDFINYSTILFVITSIGFIVFGTSTMVFFTEYENKNAICSLVMATILFSMMQSFNLDKIDEWQYGKIESIQLKIKDKKQRISPMMREIEELENKLKDLKYEDTMNFFEVLEHLRKDSNNIAYHETWNKTNPDTNIDPKIDTYICCQDGVNLEKFYTYKPSERFSNLNLMMSDGWLRDELMTLPGFSGVNPIGSGFKFNVGDFINLGIHNLNDSRYKITEINYKNEYVLISSFSRTIFSLSKEYVEQYAILCESNFKNMNFRDVIRKLKNTTNYRAKHADKIIRYSHWSDKLYICSDQKVDGLVEESFYYPTTEEILSYKWELLMVEEPKLYSFKKAVKHFLDGYSIKRYSWNNFVNKDNTDQYDDIFSVNDIQANDWQINGN